MKKLVLASLLLLVFGAVSAQAGVFVIDSFVLGSPLGSTDHEADYINDNYNDGEDVSFIWKTGTSPNDYISVDNYIEGESFDADVQWDFGDSGMGLVYILLKSGNSSYTLYGVYEDQFSSSNGVVNIAADERFKNAVSHISFFGREGTSVPEPSLIMLLGLGLGAVGLVSRRKR